METDIHFLLDYVADLLTEVIAVATQTKNSENEAVANPQPPPLCSVFERPSKEAAIDQHVSRFAVPSCQEIDSDSSDTIIL